MRPGLDDDNKLVQHVANDLWFRQVDHVKNAQERMVRRNLTSSEEDLMGTGLEDKAAHQLMAVIVTESVYIGRRRF